MEESAEGRRKWGFHLEVGGGWKGNFECALVSRRWVGARKRGERLCWWIGCWSWAEVKVASCVVGEWVVVKCAIRLAKEELFRGGVVQGRPMSSGVGLVVPGSEA